MNRYDVYHGSRRITTITAATIGHALIPARQAFDRWCWQQKQEGRQTSLFGFRLVPATQKPTQIHEGWQRKGAAND